MDYRKIDTPENFVFAHKATPPKSGEAATDQARKLTAQFGKSNLQMALSDAGSNVFRIQLSGKRWPNGNPSYAQLDSSVFNSQKSSAQLEICDEAGLRLVHNSDEILKGSKQHTFGVNGSKWMLCFEYDSQCQFYGMGGKNLGFELSGKKTKFWNTDLLADFPWETAQKAEADPLYTSFPVLIIRKNLRQQVVKADTALAADGADGAEPAGKAAPQADDAKTVWAALVINNSYPVFMNTGAGEGIFAASSTPFRRYLYAGSTNGEPDIYLLSADTPAELVCKIQKLQGCMSRPPLWSLGHQQSRWGYRSYSDLDRIAREFETRQIPNDGLWLDIDYMENFKVFTVNRNHFLNPQEQLEELHKRGFRVVPILDPGLRRDESFIEYRDAVERDLLCKTPEGINYTGFVWPGYSVFPDFSLPEARGFWAERVAQFTKQGFDAYWIDMNDPSTGSAPLEDMRFSHGSLDHDSWHNQYALGMAEATKLGLLQARPDSRPFVISRSAFLSMSRHAAVWTGDNISNIKHLKGSIAFSLNLSVSGMPFNGPDVPGFAGDASDALLRCWYKAGFLFPFFRNHNVAGAKDQEPWSRDRQTCQLVGEYIRSRYRLLPYLYNLFLEQEQSGQPVMRPLWYHCDEEWASTEAEAYFLGPDLLHAPILKEVEDSRTVRLPAGRWFDFSSGRWLHGGAGFTAKPGASTPLYGRAGSILPIRPGQISDNKTKLSVIDFLVLADKTQATEGERHIESQYRADDGETLRYREGQQSKLSLRISYSGDTATASIVKDEDGYGPIHYRLLFPVASGIRKLIVNGQKHQLKADSFFFVCRKQKVRASNFFSL